MIAALLLLLISFGAGYFFMRYALRLRLHKPQRVDVIIVSSSVVLLGLVLTHPFSIAIGWFLGMWVKHDNR